MQPLIKWPGGKSQEFSFIKHLIPAHHRYIEPFFGGGAVFFHLQPANSVINDACAELVDFYRFVKGEFNKKEFYREMYAYVDNWEKVPKYVGLFDNKLIDLYKKHKSGNISDEKLEIKVADLICSKQKSFNGLFRKDFALDNENLTRQISKNLTSKIKRTRKVEEERGQISLVDLRKNIETAFRSGFYMHFRDVMNHAGTKYDITRAKKTANYYFIREFCYASMFRFNSSGHFNIPYGGMAYNTKDFRAKVDYIFTPDVANLFLNTKITNGDFEEIIRDQNLTETDFLFLDPPYDSDFSEYEKNEFSKNDQRRLASFLYTTKAKFILIIKETPLILALYGGKKGITVERFDKTYLYNIKGRNHRDVEHLIVHNLFSSEKLRGQKKTETSKKQLAFV